MSEYVTKKLLEPRLVSNYWIMKNVFGFQDKEIQYESDEPTVPLTTAAEIAMAKAIEDHDRGTRPS